jgi:GGDEF domain-containing protein
MPQSDWAASPVMLVRMLEHNLLTFRAALRERLEREPQPPTALLLLNPKRFAFVNHQVGLQAAEELLADIEMCVGSTLPGAPACRAGAGRYAVLLMDDLALHHERISKRLHADVTALLQPHESAEMRLFASAVTRHSQRYDDQLPVLSVAVVTMRCNPESKVRAEEVMDAAQRRADTAENEVVLL